MDPVHVFVSVGTTCNAEQEAFVTAIEQRLKSEGLIPCTVGRNTFSADAPLKAVTELLDKCAGAAVIAFERTYFPSGVEKRGGPRESALADVKLPTPWNQIEAAMAYSRGLPLFVIGEHGLKSDGLLERGYDWYVQWVKLEPAALTTPEFNGVLASWKQKLLDRKSARPRSGQQDVAPTELTMGQLIGGLKPGQFWSVLVALAAAMAAAFAAGAKIFG
jgi:hypothetical protein